MPLPPHHPMPARGQVGPPFNHERPRPPCRPVQLDRHTEGAALAAPISAPPRIVANPWACRHKVQEASKLEPHDNMRATLPPFRPPAEGFGTRPSTAHSSLRAHLWPMPWQPGWSLGRFSLATLNAATCPSHGRGWQVDQPWPSFLQLPQILCRSACGAMADPGGAVSKLPNITHVSRRRWHRSNLLVIIHALIAAHSDQGQSSDGEHATSWPHSQRQAIAATCCANQSRQGGACELGNNCFLPTHLREVGTL